MTALDYLRKIQRPIETITVPQWGEVRLRGLSAAEWDRHEAASVKGEGKASTYVSDTATLIRFAVVDEAGKHVFDDTHLVALAELPAEVTRPLVKAIFKLCGIGSDLGNS